MDEKNKKRWIAINLLLFCFLVWIYRKYSFWGMYNSDTCSQLLRAREMFHGDFFLKNWYGATVPALTTNLFTGIAGYLVGGLTSKTVLYSGVILYVMITMTSVCLCTNGESNLKEKILKGSIAVVIIGIPSNNYVGEFIRSVSHLEAYIYMLLLLLLLDGVRKKYSYFLYFLLLSLALLGDSIVLYEFVLPVYAVMITNILFSNGRKRDNFCLTIVTFASLGLVTVLSKLFDSLGWWGTYDSGVSSFLSFESIIPNFLITLKVYLDYFNGSFFSLSIGSPESIKAMIGLAFFTAELLIFIILIKKYKALLLADQIMIWSVAIMTFAYMLSNMCTAESGRYLTMCIINLGILTARNYALLKESLIVRSSDYLKKHFVPILLIILCLFVYAKSFKLPDQQIIQEEDLIADILLENNLKCGYATYWRSLSTTIAANGNVRVIAVNISEDKKGFDALKWNAEKSWFEEEANFVIASKDESGLNYNEVTQILGNGDLLFETDNNYILVYDKEISNKLKY